MDRPRQLTLLRRIFSLLDSRSTDMALAPYWNPVSSYTSPKRLGHELRTLFRNGPVLVGLSGDIATPGDWCALDIAGTPVLLTRDSARQAHAFVNICRHRGMRVASGRGTQAQRFTCPYHAWSYDLLGRLCWQPGAEGFSGCDPQDLGLIDLPIAEVHGLLYVQPSPGEAIKIDTVLGGVEQELAGFKLGSYVPIETREYSRRMNWKLGIDPFLEAYHVHHLHNLYKPLRLA